MHKPFPRNLRRTFLSGLTGFLVVASLVGCAARNPLDSAAPSAKEAAVQQEGPTGARRFLGVFTPYRVDVQQGNFISREIINQIKETMRTNPNGVSREQVRFALGTPLLTDPFHDERWDYVFRLQKRNGEVLTSRVTAHFNGDRLANIEGDNLPTEEEYLSLIAGSRPGSVGRNK